MPTAKYLTYSEAPDDSGFLYPYFLGTDGSYLPKDRRYPVIQTANATYWMYTYQDNRMAFVISAFGPRRSTIGHWERKGIRYIHKITIDEAQRTVTFWGQGDETDTMTWDELKIKD